MTKDTCQTHNLDSYLDIWILYKVLSFISWFNYTMKIYFHINIILYIIILELANKYTIICYSHLFVLHPTKYFRLFPINLLKYLLYTHHYLILHNTIKVSFFTSSIHSLMPSICNNCLLFIYMYMIQHGNVSAIANILYVFIQYNSNSIIT